MLPCERYGKKLIVNAIVKAYGFDRRKAGRLADRANEVLYEGLSYCKIAQHPQNGEEFVELIEEDKHLFSRYFN